MAFKLTLMDRISFFLSKNITEATLSISPNKKFSDVKAYIEKGKFGKAAIGGRIVKQTDSGYIYTYEYIWNNNQNHYRVTVNHLGEKVTKVELYRRQAAAIAWTKNSLNVFEKKVADIPAGEKVSEEVIPAVDYSAKTLSELVNVFDKELSKFSKDSTLAALDELISIKEAINDKINEKPLAERGAYSKAIGNITTYLDALKMQMNSALSNPTQFVSMYVPQMQSALAELAALVG